MVIMETIYFILMIIIIICYLMLLESKKIIRRRPSKKPKPAANPTKVRPAVEHILSFFTPELRNALIEGCRRQAAKEIITLLQTSFS